ncbi:MAG: hypothetical protein F2612_02625 [Actinobacteria bacterium]|uniref:Unannotated protein n=1 Tax=freshwater metagenome TaxID=449393 RepID=A0A6J6JA67_9ZZZZ|nr:hypothetical protein [Actinomycetota bacterium]
MRKGLLRLVLATILIAPIGGSFPTGSVSALATTRYVAATGSVGAGTSCASPGYVGTTQSAIQSAFNAASNGDTIFICAGTYSISSRLQVTKSLTIRGAGARTTTLDGLESSQILMIHDNNLTPGSGNEITVVIDSIGFINGQATQVGSLGECEDGNRCGGAIFVESESQINITDSHFKNNYADFVGGAVARLIGNYQTVPSTITNSSFESNTANFDGGGVATLFGFGLVIESSTFYGNETLSRSAAAVIANFANATINNSTFVDNIGPNGTSVLYGDLTVNHSILAQSNPSMIPVCNSQQTAHGSRGNLVTDNSCPSLTATYPASPATNSAIVSFADLKLGDLAYRGNATKTVPLLSGSVALNFWNGCTGTDQIGISRPQGSSCDVGAYERSSSQSLNTPTGWTYSSTTLNQLYTSTLAVLTPAVDPAGQGVTYRSSTTSVCTIASNGTITAVSLGTCTVHADATGYLLRDGATVSQTITVVSSTTTTTTTTTTSTTSTTVAPNSSTPITTPAGAVTSGSTSNSPSTTTAVAQSQIPTTQRTTPTTAPSPSTPSSSSTSTSTTVPTPDAPQVAPGEAGAFIAGQNVELQISREDNALVVTGAGVEARIYGISTTGERIDLDTDGNLRLNSGDSISLDASGLEPGTEVEAWMFSTPNQLGTLSVDKAGKISGTFRIPADVASGDHRFVLKSANESGEDLVIGIGIAVGALSSGSTATRILITIPIALAAMAGLVIPTTIRRRRRATLAQ